MTEYFRPDQSTILDFRGQPLDRPVLVVTNPYAKSVKPPGTLSKSRGKGVPRAHTYDWRTQNRLLNSWGVQSELGLWDFDRALDHHFETDAYALGYVIYGPDGVPLHNAPRLSDKGIEWVESQGYTVMTHSWWGDVDNPVIPGVINPVTKKQKRRAWDHELVEESDEWMVRVPLMQHVCRYITLGGQRFVMWFEQPVRTVHARLLIAEIARDLYAGKVRLDDKCFDVVRLMRLPNVVREDTGEAYESSISFREAEPLPTSRIVQLMERGRERQAQEAASGKRTRTRLNPDKKKDPTAPPKEEAERKHTKPRVIRDVTEGALIAATQSVGVPGELAWLVEELGEAAARDKPHGRFHPLSLALSGALVRKNFPIEFLPAVVAAILKRAGSVDPGHHHANAVRTLMQFLEDGTFITGLPTIEQDFPELGKAFRRAFSRMAPPTSQEGLPSADEQSVVMFQHMDVQFQNGVYGYQARPGIGKTKCAVDLAVGNARLLRKYPTHKYRRTAIAAPTNALAEQIVRDIRKADPNAHVQRLFSPASVPGEHDGLACYFPKFVRMLASSGASVQRDACEGGGKKNGARCQHYDACTARLGAEGDGDPQILVTTHAKLADAAAFVGRSGLLIIDEPGSLTEDVELTVHRLTLAIDYEHMNSRYAALVKPLAQLLRNWLTQAERDERGDAISDNVLLHEAADVGFEMSLYDRAQLERIANAHQVAFDPSLSDGELLVTMACQAFDPTSDSKSTSCPVNRQELQIARTNPVWSARLEPVIATFNTLYELAIETMRYLVEQAKLAHLTPIERAAVAAVSPPALWTVCPPRDVRRIVAKRVDATYDALLRDWPNRRIFILDANLDVARPVIEMVTRRKLETLVLSACDNAAVSREIWQQRASRTLYFNDDGTVDWDVLLPTFKRLGRWFAKGGTAFGALVTFKRIALPLAAALGIATPAQTRALAEIAGWEAQVAAAGACVAALHARWDGDLAVAHYGSLRGLNHWMTRDALVCLGDPRDNFDAVQRDVQYIGVPPSEHTKTAAERAAMKPVQLAAYVKALQFEYATKLMEQRAKAELEQCFERLRAARRTMPCRFLMIGMIEPAGVGWGGKDVEIVSAQEGEKEARSEEEWDRSFVVKSALGAFGSVRAVARAAGVDERTARRWTGGESVPTQAHIELLISSMNEQNA